MKTLDKGKSCERVGRKATGLSLAWWDKVAELPANTAPPRGRVVTQLHIRPEDLIAKCEGKKAIPSLVDYLRLEVP